MTATHITFPKIHQFAQNICTWNSLPQDGSEIFLLESYRWNPHPYVKTGVRGNSSAEKRTEIIGELSFVKHMQKKLVFFIFVLIISVYLKRATDVEAFPAYCSGKYEKRSCHT